MSLTTFCQSCHLEDATGAKGLVGGGYPICKVIVEIVKFSVFDQIIYAHMVL